MASPPPPDGGPEDATEGPKRRLTIDDVPRLGSGAGIAVGCGALVLLAIVVFWIVRGWLLRGP